MSKMSAILNQKSLNENIYSLPPFVTGKLHGFCELFIEDIKWTTTKTYSLVNIALKFWGERNFRVFDKIEIRKKDLENKKSSFKQSGSNKNILTVTYKVCTNHRLFESYLKNCEPVIIEIFSSKTLDLIGKSVLEIPERLHNLEKNSVCEVVSDIYSNRKFKLGEIKITIEIKLNINCCSMIVEKSLPTVSLKTIPEKDFRDPMRSKKSIKAASGKLQINKGENKENLHVVGKTKTITTREPKKSSVASKVLQKQKPKIANKSIGVSNNSPNIPNLEKYNVSHVLQKSSLIDYLTGHPLVNLEDENRILSDLVQSSPSQSLIESINLNNSRTTILKNEKCLNVLVNVLELNEIGYENAQNYFKNFSETKFIFKCVLTSKLFKPKENMSFLSPVLDYPSHRIIFGKEAKRNVQLPNSSSHTYFNFGFCLKTIGYKHPSSLLIGFSRIHLEEILSNNSRFFKKCSIMNENDIKVGSVTLKIEIFDISHQQVKHKFIPEPFSISTTQLVPQQRNKIKSHPSSSNDDCDNVTERNFVHKNMQTDDSELRVKNSTRKEANSNNENREDTEMVDVESKANRRKSKVYQGVLFIEGLRSVRDHSLEYFITYDSFWNECQEMTEVSVDHQFNYLKQFPMILDADFLKKVQNNQMQLKLWEKTNENSEKFIASTRIPLHQFYIAFKDTEMIEHLQSNKLPVISTDSWCNFISPISSELYCQAKILLAIGNENQIDFLKLSRNLHNLRPPQRQTVAVDPNAQIKSKLTAFIETLSQKLPEPSNACAVSKQKFSPSSFSSNSSTEVPQLRKTSDLLDTLQKALAQPPNPDSLSLFQQPIPATSLMSLTQAPSCDTIRIIAVIEHAANLPKVIIKKCRSNKRKNKGTPPQRSEFEPHTYATFEANTNHLNENALPTNAIKSHEGVVYCTKIVKSCNPEWNQSFEVSIPFDILKNQQKKFVVKVWRKTSHEPQNNTEPKPFEDSVIGFSAIDLSVLLTGLPILSGYYSLVDFSGRSNGQIKITIKPLEDVNKFRNPSSPLVPLMEPLNIEICSLESSNDGSSSLLSRTLKRKFTELDEITQRLRARLFDVTGDENFDPDEEFERDLNTAVDEIEDIDENKGNFGWLMKENNDSGRKTNEFQQQLAEIIDSRPSTSKEPSSVPTREITGCSSETTSQFGIDDLLKKYDLDTLINPNIFKNIIDPTIANSDSTPTLNPTNDVNKNDANEESDVTTVSSIISNDQVQMIQKALQRTSLHEDEQNEPSRHEPEGKK